MTDALPDDLPEEAWFRAEMRDHLDALKEMKLDAAMGPKLTDAVGAH